MDTRLFCWCVYGVGYYKPILASDYDWFVGKPLLPVDALKLPDRPGVKVSLWGWIKLFTALIPWLPNVLLNTFRPSITDSRVHSVGSNK
jgi:hypothetical protein